MNKKIKASKKMLASSIAVCMAELLFTEAFQPPKARLMGEMEKDIRRLLRNKTIDTSELLEVPERAKQKLNSAIFKKAFNRSPWVKLVKPGVFPENMGRTVKDLRYTRSVVNS